MEFEAQERRDKATVSSYHEFLNTEFKFERRCMYGTAALLPKSMPMVGANEYPLYPISKRPRRLEIYCLYIEFHQS